MDNDVSVPSRLDRGLDDAGIGAAIKNLETDQHAIIIDYLPGSGLPVAVRSKSATVLAKRGDLYPMTPDDYELFLVDDTKNWLLLHCGHDFVLIE